MNGAALNGTRAQTHGGPGATSPASDDRLSYAGEVLFVLYVLSIGAIAVLGVIMIWSRVRRRLR